MGARPSLAEQRGYCHHLRSRRSSAEWIVTVSLFLVLPLMRWLCLLPLCCRCGTLSPESYSHCHLTQSSWDYPQEVGRIRLWVFPQRRDLESTDPCLRTQPFSPSLQRPLVVECNSIPAAMVTGGTPPMPLRERVHSCESGGFLATCLFWGHPYFYV